MNLELLDEKHPTYGDWAKTAEKIELLYCGGDALIAQASRFLPMRAKETSLAYQHRLKRFTYENHLGAGVGYYDSALWEQEPRIQIGGDVPDEWYAQFLANATGGGKSFISLCSEALLDAMLYKRAWVLLQAPGTTGEVVTRQQAEQSGALDVRLTRWHPMQAINWDEDERGELKWVMFYSLIRERMPMAEPVEYDVWHMWDRSEHVEYRSRREKGQRKPEPSKAIETERKTHILAAENRVPVRRIELPDGLWIANRACPPAVAGMRILNNYHVALEAGCLAAPVISGEFNERAGVSEMTYLNLPADGKAYYLEPSGTAYAAAMAEVDRLKQEVFRAMYLTAMARDTASTPAAASGLSKQQDMMPAQKILSGIGSEARKFLTDLLRDVVLARGGSEEVEIAGFEFEESSSLIEEIELAQQANVQSDTFDRALQKSVVRAALRNQPAQVYEVIDAEIDAQPTRLELARQREEMQRQSMRASLTSV